MRVADYVVDRLVKCGIKHIFLITGRGVLYLTDAVAKNDSICPVSTYHEQGASYAAMAYAAATDGMAACLVSTGCAATNAVTAALCAYQDNLPVIFISGQNMLNETTRYTRKPIRTFGSQEADIISIVEPITKYSTMIESADTIVTEMDKAIYWANEGRKGPVWIDIPLDIQNARVDEDNAEDTHINSGLTIKRLFPRDEDVDFIIKEIELAKRPIVLIGGGVRSSGAMLEIKRFVEACKIPLVFSTAAVDVYGSSNELSIGAMGSLGGSRAGNFAIQNADFVLAIGTKLCSQSVGDAKQFARDAKIVVVDIDETEHTKDGVDITRVVISDARNFLDVLNSRAIALETDDWCERCKHWKELFAIHNEPFIKELRREKCTDLYLFADTISELLPDDATVITDAGFEELIIPSAIRYKSGQRCLFPASQGAMGYAIPAILGAYYGGKKNIVAILGDGSFMMNMQELQFIGSFRIPAKIFVINNNMYAVIRKRQKDLFRNRTIGNDPSDGLPAPNFERIANAFNIDYTKIDFEDDLCDLINKVLNSNGPQICEVMSVEDQKYLHTSFAFNDKRKLIKRSLEDLSPFLDRDTIKREMIVDPLEVL